MTGAPLSGLQPLRWWDLPEVAAIERGLFGEDAWSEATWWAELAQVDTRRYLLDRDPASGAVRGYAGLAVSGPDADVMTVAVAPGWQRRGLGRRLTLAIVWLAGDAGEIHMLLEVLAYNVPSQRLYS